MDKHTFHLKVLKIKVQNIEKVDGPTIQRTPGNPNFPSKKEGGIFNLK
jgi:hypothetical protein